jgi:hypothetical protein
MIMKHIVRKMFWDYEKEERWLNEKSAKGLMLTEYSWCRYVFTEGSANEYTYRIELLKHPPTHPDSIDYIQFLEHSGVERITVYARWIYFRRKSSEGAFDIYSDLESKINHFKRIHLLWLTLMAAEWIVGLINLIIGIVNLNANQNLESYSMGNIIAGCLLLLLGLFFWIIGAPIRKKIKTLRQEKEIRE